MTKAQRQRIIVHTDAGLGTDENINWLLWGGYQVGMKGFSGPRAGSWAKQIQRMPGAKILRALAGLPTPYIHLGLGDA